MNGENATIYQRLNPLDEDPIGKYGTMWMQWMEEYYPEKVEWMTLHNQYLTVTHSVEQRTSNNYIWTFWNVRNQMRKCYAAADLFMSDN